MKKAIVTGANGFIGTHLIDYLVKHDIEVTAVVRSVLSDISNLPKSVKVVYCDLQSITTLDSVITDRDYDVFYHLAWDGTAGPSRANYPQQLDNVRNTCDAAIVSKKINALKFITTGTISEKIAETAIENHVTSENLIYGIAKSTTHEILDVICHKNRIDYVWAQLSNIYGGNNNSGNILSYTLKELKNGNRPTFSKAEQPYDFLFVEDAVKALYLLGTQTTRHSSYFIGSGKPRILKEYLYAISDYFGGSSAIGIGVRPEDGAVYHREWFDISTLTEDTGFVPDHEFEYYLKAMMTELK